MKWAFAAVALAALALSTPAIGSFHDTLNTVPDRAFPLLMSGTTFNGLAFPNTPLLEGYLGERTRFITVATEGHTFHLHGHPWLLEDGRVVDTFLVDADTPHAFDVIAGGVDRHAGDWMYHCHIDAHMQAGMWGIFRVYPYSFELTLPAVGAGAMHVRLADVGVPVDGATFALTVDGRPLPVHAEALGGGEYALHAALPPAGSVVVTATHPDLGASVARASLDGTPAPTLALPLGAHAHAP